MFDAEKFLSELSNEQDKISRMLASNQHVEIEFPGYGRIYIDEVTPNDFVDISVKSTLYNLYGDKGEAYFEQALKTVNQGL
jgi:hypothetical protein